MSSCDQRKVLGGNLGYVSVPENFMELVSQAGSRAASADTAQLLENEI